MRARFRLGTREARSTKGSRSGPAESWTFDLSLEDDELLAQESIFDDQFRLSPGQIARETAEWAVSGWVGPGNEAGLEQTAGSADEPVHAVGKMDRHRGYVLRAGIGRSVQRSRQHAGRRISRTFDLLSA
jgi:hypothetical protein